MPTVFVALSSERMIEFKENDLLELWQQGFLSPQLLCWKDGMEEWIALSSFFEKKHPQALTPIHERVRYAHFFERFLAMVLDILILLVFLYPLLGPLSLDIASLPSILLNTLFQCLYYAGFESSSWQATPGKKLLKLQVTTLTGHPASFLQASIRYFAKNISMLFLGLGYFIMPFTERKQALHDILAKCLVLSNHEPS